MIDIHFKIGKHEVAKEINRTQVEKIQCLLSNAQLDKSFLAEALEYASHLMNKSSSTVIGGKTLLDIQLGGAAQEYDLLQVFEYSANFSTKDGKLNL